MWSASLFVIWRVAGPNSPGTNHEPLDEGAADEKDTRQALLANSKREFVPIRKTFVQTPRTVAADPNALAGPLSEFVRRRDLRALQSYLMILAATSSGAGEHGWSTTHPIMVWARAFGTTRDAERTGAAGAVSKILHRLEDRDLITRARSGRERRIRVTLRREDGSGEEYTRPMGNAVADRYLRLDHAYWTQGWCDELRLPGIAMLLVLLHEKPGARLPAEHMPKWYGWSADTAERGLDELAKHGLLVKGQRVRKEPLSAAGYGRVNEYYLNPPFGPGDPLLWPPQPESPPVKTKKFESKKTIKTTKTPEK